MNNLDEVVEALRPVAHLLPTRIFLTDPSGAYVWGSVVPSEVAEITAAGPPATWTRCSTEVLTNDVGALIGYLSSLSDTSPSTDERFDVAVAHAAKELGRHHGMAVSLDLSPDVVVAGDVAESLLRILSEAMTNAGRHGRANRVAVRLWRSGDVHLVVDDDGSGFTDDQPTRAGFGLRGMQERAHAMAGKLMVASSPGRGTCVEAVIP